MQEGVAAIQQSVNADVSRCVFEARAKLIRRSRQFTQTQILMVGGGVCKHPYEAGIYPSAFSHWNLSPQSHPLPLPPSLLPLPTLTYELYRRFTVAYGLSFLRATLEEHCFPMEMVPSRKRHTINWSNCLRFQRRCVTSGTSCLIYSRWIQAVINLTMMSLATASVFVAAMSNPWLWHTGISPTHNDWLRIWLRPFGL